MIMKKATKQKLVVLFIILIFGMSTIAFVFLGITGNIGTEQQGLTSPVIEEEIDPQLESAYIQNGITFLKYYYKEKDDIYNYVGTLPGTLTTSDGQVQMVVERIQSDEERMVIDSIYGGTEELAEITYDSVLSSLCSHLVSTPPECALRALNSNT
jgi:hypothetical protein